MGTTANRDAAVGAVHDLLASFDELGNIAEIRRTVRIGEQNILTPDVSEAVGHPAALAAVLLQRDHPQQIVELVVSGKVEHHFHGAVRAPVIDDEDLIATRLPVLGVSRPLPAPALAARSAAHPANVLIQPGDGLLQRRHDAVLLVVRGEDDAQVDLGGLDVARVRRRLLGAALVWVLGVGLFAGLALGEPAVVPAGQLARARGLPGRGLRRDIRLLGGDYGAWLGGDEVEEDEELYGTRA